MLPQKGRPVPSLFLFYLSADFRSRVLRPPPGAISVDRASSGFGYGGGIWVYYEFQLKLLHSCGDAANKVALPPSLGPVAWGGVCGIRP